MGSSLRVLVSSFSDVHELTRADHDALEGVKRLLGKPTAGNSPSGFELADADKLRDFNGL